MTGQQFKEKLAEAENPVVIYVWAPWCRPCRVLSPVAWLEVAIWVVAGLVLVAGSWLSGGSTVLLAVGCLLAATGLLKIIKRD